jgi:hypothetical protein
MYHLFNPFSPARLWYVKGSPIDTDGPKPTLVVDAASVSAQARLCCFGRKWLDLTRKYLKREMEN